MQLSPSLPLSPSPSLPLADRGTESVEITSDSTGSECTNYLSSYACLAINHDGVHPCEVVWISAEIISLVVIFLLSMTACGCLAINLDGVTAMTACDCFGAVVPVKPNEA